MGDAAEKGEDDGHSDRRSSQSCNPDGGSLGRWSAEPWSVPYGVGIRGEISCDNREAAHHNIIEDCASRGPPLPTRLIAAILSWSAACDQPRGVTLNLGSAQRLSPRIREMSAELFTDRNIHSTILATIENVVLAAAPEAVGTPGDSEDQHIR